MAAEPPPRVLPSERAHDPRFAPLLVRYLMSLREQREELRGALEAGDGDAVRHIAHKLRGTGGSYGFQAITAAAGELEEALRAGGSLAEQQAGTARLDLLLGAAIRSGDPSYP